MVLSTAVSGTNSGQIVYHRGSVEWFETIKTHCVIFWT